MSTKPASLLLVLPFLGAPSANPVAAASLAATTDEAVDWNFGSFDAVLRDAARGDQLVLVYFWMPSSGQCTDMYEQTFQSDAAAVATAPFLCYSANHAEAQGAELFERYQITTVPAVRVLRPTGEAEDGMNGFADAVTLAGELERIGKGIGTLSALRGEAEAAPDDLDLRNKLAGKLLDLGDQAGHDELQASIRADDPEGQTRIGAQLLLNDALSAAVAEATTPAEIDLAALYAHAEQVGLPDVAFTCWSNIATIETCVNGVESELAALARAWPLAPESRKVFWGQSMADWLWSCRDELDKQHKQLALEMAAIAAERAELIADAGTDGFGNSYNGNDPDGFLAGFVNTHARCAYMNGMVPEARELAAFAVKLAPASPEYTARLAAYEARDSDGNFHVYSDSRPVWSPNGKQILFTSDRDGNQELYLADVKKGTEKRLTYMRSNETSGTFDPKGRTILFNSNRFKGTWSVFSMTSAGKRQELLVPFDLTTPVSLSDPSYAPNGKSIAYTTTRNGKSEIAVAKADGSDERILTAATENTDMQPFWAPKGDEIYYMSTRLGDSDVWAIRADGEDDRNVTNAPENSWDMDGNLSPDGERVVFSSWRSGQLEIYICDRDGSNVRALTQSDTEDRYPRWSPKGDRIVFTRKHADGSQRLFVMDADGSNLAPVLEQR